MDLTVIICSYRRPSSLRRTLASLAQSRLPANVHWELLVVDNNSRDQTPAVVQEFTTRLPLRYLLEPAAGLNHARNRGLDHAQGGLVLFTDDDVEVEPGWLTAYQQAAIRHPRAVYFAGKILPRWETPAPRWLQRNSADVLRGVTVHYDLGGTERALRANSHDSPFGANMAFRGALFRQEPPLRFPGQVGTRGYQQLLRGDETAVFDALQRCGLPGVYVPTAVVYHWLPAERLTRAYVRRWFEDNGRSRVRFGLATVRPTTVLWQYAFNNLRYGLARWLLPSRLWLRAERNRAVARGMWQELRQKEVVPGEGIEPPTKGL